MSVQLRRMAIAVVALAGLFISGYLLLYKLGFYGALRCGAGGSCSYVQASRYAVFLGIPVAGWGTAWYGAVFALALLGVQGRFSETAWPGRWILVLAAGGLGFSAYLTWVELFVLEAICRWCVVSALLVLAIFALSLPAAREGGREREGRGRRTDRTAPAEP